MSAFEVTALTEGVGWASVGVYETEAKAVGAARYMSQRPRYENTEVRVLVETPQAIRQIIFKRGKRIN